jgi:hypothetical protein
MITTSRRLTLAPISTESSPSGNRSMLHGVGVTQSSPATRCASDVAAVPAMSR